MNFESFLEVYLGKGEPYESQIKRRLNLVYSLTDSELNVKWSYVKNPFGEVADYFVFNGERLFKLTFIDNSTSDISVESWRLKNVGNISLKIAPLMNGVSVYNLQITNQDGISFNFNSKNDAPQYEVMTRQTLDRIALYNDGITKLYDILK